MPRAESIGQSSPTTGTTTATHDLLVLALPLACAVACETPTTRLA
jgi:hypothetical protein